MLKIKPKQPLIFIGLLIILVELLSFLAYFLPFLQIYFLSLIFVATLIASLLSLETGVLILLIELVLGSKGHLFTASFLGFSLSLRLVIFIAIMIASFVYLFRHNTRIIYQEKIKAYKFWPLLIALSFFIFVAVINGIISNNNLNFLFHDFNAWLFLPIILPLILVYLPNPKQEHVDRLLKIFFLAIIILSLKSLFFLYAFSHNLVFISDLYLWIRRSGLGEITAMGGGYNRIFIQSQVYLAVATFIILFKAIAKPKSRYLEFKQLLLLSLVISGLILSMSRSFWLAVIVAGLIGSIMIFKKNLSKYLHALTYLVFALFLALAFIFIVIKFPIPNSQEVSLSALSERLDITHNEAAAASRWALLPALAQKILEQPVIGSGFGATVSYYSQDPRVLAQNEGGLYTSYAFEWAYLDTWLKLGFLGITIFLAFVIQIFISLWQESKRLKSPVLSALAVSLIFFVIVNIFTPYLNHPLGLAFLLFSSCFVKKNCI